MSVAESTYPEPSLEVICRNGALTGSATLPAPREAHALQSVFQNRRSIRRLQDGPFSLEMQRRVLEAVRLTPAAYNLPPWRLVLVHEHREESWQQIETAFRDQLSGDRLERNLGRLEGFRPGVALALLYEDLRVGRTLREEKGASAELATQFVRMFGDPLANRPPIALPTDERRADQRQEERPGMAFAPGLAGIRHIRDGVHQAAILPTIHHPPSFVLGRQSDCR